MSVPRTPSVVRNAEARVAVRRLTDAEVLRGLSTAKGYLSLYRAEAARRGLNTTDRRIT